MDRYTLYNTARAALCAAIAAMAATSCVKDHLEDSALIGQGAVMLLADFSAHSSDMPLPGTYQVLLDGREFNVPSHDAYLLPCSFTPMATTLIAFNEPQGMERQGMTMRVRQLSDGSIDPMPQPLFAARADIIIPKDDTLHLALPMRQHLYAVRFELPVTRGDAALIQQVEGEVTGVAQHFDLARQEVTGGTPASIRLSFYREEEASTHAMRRSTATTTYIGQAGLLGIDGQVQQLTLHIGYTNGTWQTIVTDISTMMTGFGSGQSLEPLVITGGMEAPMEAGLEATISGWQVRNGEVEIRQVPHTGNREITDGAERY